MENGDSSLLFLYGYLIFSTCPHHGRNGKREENTAFRKIQIHTFGKSLKRLIDGNRSCQEVSEAADVFRQAYANVVEKHEAYVLYLDESEFESEECWIEEITDIADATLVVVNDYMKKPTVTGNEQDTQTNNSASIVNIPPLKLRTESAPLPKFSGDVQQYFSFKRDFTYLVEGQYAPQASLYLLRNCLGPKPAEWIQGEIEYSEAWATLDRHYGDVRLTSDALIRQISKFKPLGEYDPRLADSYHLVKKTAKVLNVLQRPGDLENTTTLSQIEKKTPSERSSEMGSAATQGTR